MNKYQRFKLVFLFQDPGQHPHHTHTHPPTHHQFCLRPWNQAAIPFNLLCVHSVQWLRIFLKYRKLRLDLWVGKIPWGRAWLPTPVFLPGKSHGERSLVGYSPWGHTESGTAKQLRIHNVKHTTKYCTHMLLSSLQQSSSGKTHYAISTSNLENYFNISVLEY